LIILLFYGLEYLNYVFRSRCAGNGTLDWNEFKELATTMVEVSRVSKDKKQKKEKEQNRKAAARNEKVLIQQAKKDSSLREDSEEDAGAGSSKPGGGKVVWGNLADAIFEDVPQDSVLQVVRAGSGSGPGSQRRGSIMGQNRDSFKGFAPDVPIQEGATSKHVLMAVLESNVRIRHMFPHAGSDVRCVINVRYSFNVAFDPFSS
jgi:hypothetical protein